MAVRSALADRELEYLQQGLPVVIITLGGDGWPHAVMAWGLALSRERVRFTVDSGTATLQNLQREGKATLYVIGGDHLIFSVKGTARQVSDRVRAAPFHMAMWEMFVREVKDQSWPGATVTPISYEWTGPKASELRRIEQAVFAELRS